MASNKPIRAIPPVDAGDSIGQQLPLNWQDARQAGPVLVHSEADTPPTPLQNEVPHETVLSFWQFRQEPLFWSLADNLATLISVPPANLPKAAWSQATLLRTARICSEATGAKRNPLHWGASLAGHAALVAVAVLWPTLGDWNPPPTQPTVRELLDQYTVLYYSKDELLPLIAPSPAKAPAKSESTSAAEQPSMRTPRAQSPRIRLAPAHGSQPMLSERAKVDNHHQTIVQPQAPDIHLPTDVEVPNLVAVNREVPAPPPSPKDFGRQKIAHIERTTPLPTPEPAKREAPLPKQEPAAPRLQAMAVRASDISLSPVSTANLPIPQVPVRFRRTPDTPAAKPAPVAKSMPDAPRNISMGEVVKADLPDTAGQAISMRDLPSFPVPVRFQHPVPATAQREVVVRQMPDAPDISGQGIRDSLPSQVSLPTLVAVSINAPPPADNLHIPVGNRAGEFSADNTGVWSLGGGTGDSRNLSKASAERESGGGSSGGEFNIPGLSVRGGESAPTEDPSSNRPQSTRPLPPKGTESSQLIAALARPKLVADIPARGQPAAAPYFGPRKVYTSHVNMPNFSSRSGSWVLRFAEKQGQEGYGDLAAPEVMRKVDPAYEADAQREHIAGMILLAAIVRADGSVGNVRLVRGLDARLDVSAISAFTQWKFRPATRQGRPVELEVLVQIPFAIN